MKKHAESHMDHGFSQAQWDYIFTKFAAKDAFFIETIELPLGLGSVTHDLYGPTGHGSPVNEHEVYYAPRGDRTWDSRMIRMPKQSTRFVRVIAGPHEEHACILYTAYGVESIDAPQTPKEPGDIEAQIAAVTPRYEAARAEGNPGLEDHELLHKLHTQLKESVAFWAQHALAE